jgi:hypothetical protein
LKPCAGPAYIEFESPGIPYGSAVDLPYGSAVDLPYGSSAG